MTRKEMPEIRTVTVFNSIPVTATVFTGDISLSCLRLFTKAKRVGLDIETTAEQREDLLRPERADITLVTLHAGHRFAPVLLRVRRGVYPANLIQLLEDVSVTKVIQHAPFDLACIGYEWGTLVRSVQCTRLMAKMLNFSSTERSLKPLIAHYFGIEIEKDQATSDWTAENLTDNQVRYAVEDVYFLLALADAQYAELAKRPTTLERYKALCHWMPHFIHWKICDVDPATFYER